MQKSFGFSKERLMNKRRERNNERKEEEGEGEEEEDNKRVKLELLFDNS